MANDVHQEAVRLEALLPRIMRVLFHHNDTDPLGHLSMAQLRMMRRLYSDPLMTSEMSTDLGMTPSAVSQTASRLEKLGLIERRSDPHDRRIRRLALTEEGQRLMHERQGLRVNRAKAVLQEIPYDHHRRLIDALEELLEACGPEPVAEPLALVTELEQGLPTVPPYSDQESKEE